MFPKALSIQINDICGIKCNHCFVKDRYGHINAPANMIYKLIDECSENRVILISFSGGDPLFHPDIFGFLKAAYDKNIIAVAGITGTGVTEDIASNFANACCKCVQVSLNGSRPNYDSIIKGVDVFDETILGIKRLQSKGINVNAAICLCNENFENFDELIAFLDSLNVYKVKVQFFSNINGAAIAELSDNQKEEIITRCRLYEKVHNKTSWLMSEDLKMDTVLQMHENAIIVLPNGDVKYSLFSENLGSLHEKSLKEICEI